MQENKSEYNKELDNPVTNGATKKIVKWIVIMIGTLAMFLGLALFTLEVLTFIFDNGFITPATLYSISSVEGILVGALCYGMNKFFDTRDAATKAEHIHEDKRIKNKRLQIKLDHKLAMRKAKLNAKKERGGKCFSDTKK